MSVRVYGNGKLLKDGIDYTFENGNITTAFNGEIRVEYTREHMPNRAERRAKRFRHG